MRQDVTNGAWNYASRPRDGRGARVDVARRVIAKHGERLPRPGLSVCKAGSVEAFRDAEHAVAHLREHLLLRGLGREHAVKCARRRARPAAHGDTTG